MIESNRYSIKKVNCKKCVHCIPGEKPKTFICKFKKINMGYGVYYENENAYVKNHKGEIFCDYKKKREGLSKYLSDKNG